ncbi:glycosyltransferase family 31 protein [Neurospora crassa]|nr:glycosyltransferase family 31 protein [Neurospora crassa]
MSKMGATIIPAPHRCFNMRNPLAKALVLFISVSLFGTLLLQQSGDIDVRAAFLKTASTAKDAVSSSQRPLGGNHPQSGWGGDSVHTPVELTGAYQPDHPNELGNITANGNMHCDYDMDRLREWKKKYKLQDRFEYTRRYVQVSRQPIARKSLTKLDQNFLSDHVKVVDINKHYQPEACPAPLVVPVSRSPYPSTANASDFMFGVSTTYKRFVDPKTNPTNEWKYWLTDNNGSSNGGKLLLMLMGASDSEMADVREQLTSVGIDVDVYRSSPSDEMAVRYLTLVPTLYNHPLRSQKKWLVTCDDDTFFPSLHALIAQFETYDHTKPKYIGTFSEDSNNVMRHGEQAFGGAGVFLSVPLAALVTENFAQCKSPEKIKEANTGWGPQGDVLLRKCIYEHSPVRLTLLDSLWQLDMLGDPSGFYESGIQPLSLHHYRGGGWHSALPFHYTKVSHLCGEECMMQRFMTADDFVISNGFSVAYYPEGTDDLDFDQLEGTFRSAPDYKGWNLDFKWGPQRAGLAKTGRKLSWDLQEAEIIWEDDEQKAAEGGNKRDQSEEGQNESAQQEKKKKKGERRKVKEVRQIYVRKHDDWRWKLADGATPMSRFDGVVELIWLPDTKE